MGVDFPICDDDEDDQNNDEVPSVSNTSNGFDHIHCIVSNKIQLIGEHPLTVMIASTLRQHDKVVKQIVSTAIREAIDDIDVDWVAKKLELFHFKQNDWKKIYNCRNYLLEFARYAAFEGQLQKVSDSLRARQFRKLRVDEVDTNGHGRGSKRSHHQSAEEGEEDDNSDPYLKDFSRSDSLFAEEFLLSSSNASSFHYEKEELNFSIEHQEDLSRRRELRAQSSADIGFVSALGKESKREPIMINKNLSGVARNHNGVEERDYSVHQRKKRTFVNQLNHLQNNIQKRNLDSTIVQSALNAQKAIIQGVTCVSEFNSSAACSSEIYDATDALGRPPKKSCLRKAKRKKVNHRIKFSDGVNFDKISSGAYVNKTTRRRTGQNRTNFISLSFDSLSIDSSELDDANGIHLPNCDMRIKPAIRENPLFGKNLPKIKEGIKTDFYLVMKRALYCKKVCTVGNERPPPMLVSRLLVTDSMLSSLDCDIFRNMDLVKLVYPRMPMWFLETLDEWFDDDNLKFTDGGVFLYSKVFISLGLDLHFYYADPKGEEIEVQLKFLQELAEWFKNKVELIRKVIRQRERGALSLQKRHSEIELFYKKTSKEDDIASQFKIVQIPTFVIITTPEIGGWRRYFAQLNNRLREFVQQPSNTPFFDLLDWAELVKSAPSESVKTVASRAALLANFLHEEHGVFYV